MSQCRLMIVPRRSRNSRSPSPGTQSPLSTNKPASCHYRRASERPDRSVESRARTHSSTTHDRVSPVSRLSGSATTNRANGRIAPVEATWLLENHVSTQVYTVSQTSTSLKEFPDPISGTPFCIRQKRIPIVRTQSADTKISGKVLSEHTQNCFQLLCRHIPDQLQAWKRGKHGTCGMSGAVPCRVAPLQRYLQRCQSMIGYSLIL